MPRRRRPRPGAGQLTLEQALSRAVRENALVETDSDEPEETLSPSSSEQDDMRDTTWHPSPRRHACPDSSDGEMIRFTVESDLIVKTRIMYHIFINSH